MKILRILAATAAIAAIAPAQTCLSTLFAANNGGSPGGAVYFDITVTNPMQIVGLETNYDETVGNPVGIQVYMTAAGGTHAGNETNAAVWTQVGQDDGNATSAGLDVPTSITLASPILMNPGTYGVALVAVGDGHRYTNGNGSNQNYSDANLAIALGTASNVPFTGGIFSPRIWNGSICYNLGSNFARANAFGDGCGGDAAPSFYEDFRSGFDLAGTAHQYLFNGTNYVIVPSSGTIVTPVGAPLTVGDDTVNQVTLPFNFPRPGGPITDIFVDSNGRIGFASITSDFGEAVSDLLSGPSTICPLWDDLNPSAAGTIHAEQDPTDPTLFHVTWTSVPEFSNTGSNDFQVTFSSSGGMEVKYGACSVADCLVGYSPGNGSTGESYDISSGTPIMLGTGRPDLALVNVARPVIGTTSQSDTNNIPAGSLGGVLAIGFSQIQPPFDLGAIGATGCTWYAAADVTVSFATPGASAAHQLAIPNTPSLAGGSLFLQSFVVNPVFNAARLGSSNGMEYILDVN